MPRATNNVAAHARTKKILAATKGHKGSRSRWKRSAIESRMKAMLYATRDRKNKKREFRALWIARINAASRQHDMPYNRFISGLQAAGVDIDRKMLADLAVRDSAAFAELVTVAKKRGRRCGITAGRLATDARVTITSVHNPLIAEIRSLHRRKGRREQGAFLVEGVRLVTEAANVGAPIRSLILCPDMLGDAEDVLRAQVERMSAVPRVITVDPHVMRLLADTETPQGAVAVAALPVTELPRPDPERALLLVLDGLRDPGNVGTLLRAGAAAGCDAVVTTLGTADPFAPKVVRAAMGAHFRVPVLSDVEWDWLGPTLVPLPAIYGADAGAPEMYDAVDWRAGTALVVGHEDHGLSEKARRWCRGTVAIPMARGVESLNAAVSGAIILFEAVRQRRLPVQG